jgi:hypothetical protein
VSQNQQIFHLQFAPEHWSNLYYLRAMLGPPLPTTRETYEALDACIGHLQKFNVFGRIAKRIIPNLPKDREELDHCGASRNIHSSELAALLEAMVCELYAALDGFRAFLCAVYPKMQGLQNQSNEKLLRRAKERAYKPSLPEPVNAALGRAYDEWFVKLRKLRSELTHGTPGFCWADTGGSVRYMNEGLGSSTRAYVNENILDAVETYREQVTRLLEEVSSHFATLLEPIARVFPCGMFNNRMYLRMVTPKWPMTSADGQCASWNWFEKEPAHLCPLATKCEAYKNRFPGGDVAALAAAGGNSANAGEGQLLKN